MPRILVIDEDRARRSWIAGVLRRAGHDVVAADGGRAAITALGTAELDAVLIDAAIADVDPIELCAAVRDDAQIADVPIVLVTGHDDAEVRRRGIEAGVDELLSRPIDEAELVVRVRSLVRAREDRMARDRQRHLVSAILDAMDEGVVVADERHGYTLANRAAQRMLGPSAGWPAPAYWPRRGEAAAPLARALAGETPVEADVIVAARDKRHYHITARPLPVIAGDAPGALAVFRDTTRLTELDQFKADMTSYVVHDLKNAMLVINTNLELTLEEPLPGDARGSMLEARDACDRACRLIANLMDVARLEESRLRLQARPIELLDACQPLIGSRATQLRARRIEVAVDLAGAPRVRADHDILQRVVDNVIDNAIRYTPAGGRIVLQASATPDTVRLRIGNTGAPIPVEQRGVIFEKGRRLGESNRHNAGLGLHFCRLALTAHKGRIWVDSTPELPTVFVIELPQAEGIAVGSQPRRVRTPSLAALMRGDG